MTNTNYMSDLKLKVEIVAAYSGHEWLIYPAEVSTPVALADGFKSEAKAREHATAQGWEVVSVDDREAMQPMAVWGPDYQACGYGCKVDRSGPTKIPSPLYIRKVDGVGVLGFCSACNRNSRLNGYSYINKKAVV